MAKVIKKEEGSAIRRSVGAEEKSAVRKGVVKAREGSVIRKAPVAPVPEGSAIHRNVVKAREGSVIRKAPVGPDPNGSVIRRAPAGPDPEGSAIHRGVAADPEGSSLHHVDLASEDDTRTVQDMPAPDLARLQAEAQDKAADRDPDTPRFEHPGDEPEPEAVAAPPPEEPKRPAAKKVAKKKLHPKTTAAAKKEAEAIVARAEADARSLQRAVEEEIETAIADARTQGHSAGLTETEALKAQMEQLGQTLLHEVEPEALKVATKLSRRLYDTELEEHPESIVDIVRQALLSSRQQREIFVRVHPVHIEVLRAHKTEIIDVLGRAKDVDFREDGDLEAGGCVIETEVGTVDARIETQFEVLSRHLKSGGS